MPPETNKNEDCYNATIAKITPIADGLSIFHLKPDEPIGLVRITTRKISLKCHHASGRFAVNILQDRAS